ncbi:MAG TPA: GNAT family N-acetyltransferase [Phototrophicaceae bacterium]|nr:GNAT family N-acetyltransferase [Phototrophicaceae bacterium]
MTSKSFIQTVLVRPVELSDTVMLQRMCWPERLYEDITEMLRRAQKLAQTRRGLGVVAESSGTLCGFGLLTLWPRAAEISDLFVNANYRSQGVGSQIIAYLTQAARELKVKTLEIGVALSNPRAELLYRRLNFMDGRTIELNLGDGPEPVLYLYKNLD